MSRERFVETLLHESNHEYAHYSSLYLTMQRALEQTQAATPHLYRPLMKGCGSPPPGEAHTQTFAQSGTQTLDGRACK